MTSTPARQRPEPERRQRTVHPTHRSTKPARAVPTAGPRAMLQLQSAAGNTAVAGLLAGRGVGVQRLDAGPGGCPPPPVAPPGTMPAQDPKFAELKGDIAGKAKTTKAHPPAGAEVKKAQDRSAHGRTDEYAAQLRDDDRCRTGRLPVRAPRRPTWGRADLENVEIVQPLSVSTSFRLPPHEASAIQGQLSEGVAASRRERVDATSPCAARRAEPRRRSRHRTAAA